MSDVALDKLEYRDQIALKLLKVVNPNINLTDFLKKRPYNSILVPYAWVTNSSNLVKLAHSFNLKIAAWTPDKKQDIKNVLGRQVDAVISNNIKELKYQLSLKPNSNFLIDTNP